MSKEKNTAQTQAAPLSAELLAFLGSVISWPIQMHKQKVPGNMQKDILPDNIYTHVAQSESEAITLFNAGWRKHPDDFLNTAGAAIDAQTRKQIDQAKLAGLKTQIAAFKADLLTLSENDEDGRAKILSDIANFEAVQAELEAALGK